MITGPPRPVDAVEGDEIPIFRRAATLHHWNRYAAVNDEFYDIHMDDEAGRAAGYPSAIGMGNLQFAYINNMLADWIGDGGTISRVACHFRGASLRNNSITAHGIVAAVRDEGMHRTVDLTVWTEDDAGEQLARGTASVTLQRDER